MYYNLQQIFIFINLNILGQTLGNGPMSLISAYFASLKERKARQNAMLTVASPPFSRLNKLTVFTKVSTNVMLREATRSSQLLVFQN